MTIKSVWVRFSAIQEDDCGWSVIENATGLAYLAAGVPMVLLSRDVATALAKALNELSFLAPTLH